MGSVMGHAFVVGTPGSLTVTLRMRPSLPASHSAVHSSTCLMRVLLTALGVNFVAAQPLWQVRAHTAEWEARGIIGTAKGLDWKIGTAAQRSWDTH